MFGLSFRTRGNKIVIKGFQIAGNLDKLNQYGLLIVKLELTIKQQLSTEYSGKTGDMSRRCSRCSVEVKMMLKQTLSMTRSLNFIFVLSYSVVD